MRISKVQIFVYALITACGSPDKADVCPGFEGLDAAQCATAQSMLLPTQLVASRGNAKADDVAAARLGFEIFYDARFSSNLEMRCATCHQPEQNFHDGIATSVGLEKVQRNSPTVINAAWMSWQLWDGAADSLWSQPLFAFENPKEMNFSRLEVAHRIDESYRSEYQEIFGELPNLSRFPKQGRPGQAEFDQLALVDQLIINRVAANVGKSLEAYMRKLAAGQSAFDKALMGDALALPLAAQRGFAQFIKSGCDRCHSGAMFTDEKFHNLGVAALPGMQADMGRLKGLEVLMGNPFSSYGAFYDGPKPQEPSPAANESDLGAFRTPSLRNVSRSAPYGHNGRFATLDEVVDFHLAGGGAGKAGYLGEVDALLTPQALSADERADLVAFLLSLDGQYPDRPWNYWPDR